MEIKDFKPQIEKEWRLYFSYGVKAHNEELALTGFKTREEASKKLIEYFEEFLKSNEYEDYWRQQCPLEIDLTPVEENKLQGKYIDDTRALFCEYIRRKVKEERE